MIEVKVGSNHVKSVIKPNNTPSKSDGYDVASWYGLIAVFRLNRFINREIHSGYEYNAASYGLVRSG